MTPFEKAGYTKDTKFRIIVSTLDFNKGDIVTLYEDDGSYSPWFKNEDGGWNWLCLPKMAPKGYEEELEVYEEPNKELTPFEKAGYTKATKFRVIKDCYSLKKGDIVTLYLDNGTECPVFKTEDGREDLCWLPNMSLVYYEEVLEVYEEPKKDSKALVERLDNIEKLLKEVTKEIEEIKSNKT